MTTRATEEVQAVTTKILYRVTAPHFCAGMIVVGLHVVDAAPILRWAIGKHMSYLASYFKRKGWTMEEVQA